MKKHIDDVQALSVKEHFDEIMRDERIVDPKYTPVTIKDFPDWYEERLFKQGQEYYDRNTYSIGMAQLAGLVTILSVPKVLKVLIYTKQSCTPYTALKRYLETLIHIYHMFMSNVNDKNSKFYKSINTIRWKHAMTNKRCLANKIDVITQKDMVLTQYCFIVYTMCSPHTLGLTNDPDEREAFNHYWRVVAYLLGIPDNLNVCRKSEAETTELCQMIRDNVFSEYLKNGSEDFYYMTKVLLDGFWTLDVTLNVHANMLLAYELAGVEYKKPVNLYGKFMYGYFKVTMGIFKYPIVGPILRIILNSFIPMNIWINLNYPIFAKIRFGDNFRPLVLYPNLDE